MGMQEKGMYAKIVSGTPSTKSPITIANELLALERAVAQLGEAASALQQDLAPVMSRSEPALTANSGTLLDDMVASPLATRLIAIRLEVIMAVGVFSRIRDRLDVAEIG